MTADGSAPLVPEVLQERSARLAVKSEQRLAPVRPVAATPDERLPVVTERVLAALLPPVAKLEQRLAPVRSVAATPDERLPVVTERVLVALLPPAAKLEKLGQRWGVPEVLPRPAAGPDARQREVAERRAASE